MSLTQYLPQEHAHVRFSCMQMSPKKLESYTPDVIEAVSLYAAWYALEVFEYLCERTGAPKGCAECMLRAGKLAKEKVGHLFLSKGVEFSHIEPLREAARALAAEAIKKSGQF